MALAFDAWTGGRRKGQRAEIWPASGRNRGIALPASRIGGDRYHGGTRKNGSAMTKEELEKLQALSEPQPVPGNGEEQPRWDEQVRTAMDARRMGAQLRRGKPKSFRPVVGRI